MAVMDAVVRNGEIVTPAGSIGPVDIGIANGIIAQMGGALRGRREIDAAGKLVLPGGVDAHVHLSPPGQGEAGPRWVDDYSSGSAAALAGGITTLGNMTFPAPGEAPLAALEREAKVAREQIVADLFLHPVLYEVTPKVLDDIPRLLHTGCNSIKLFMVFPWFDSQVRDFVKAFRSAGAHGLITMIHCEDHALIRDAMACLMAGGKSSLRYYADSRPVVSEVVATQRAVGFSESTGAPVYIVHLSCARALEVCVEAQGRNLPVYVETRPLYLHLTRERFEEEDGAKYVGQPPLREQRDVEALWAGIAKGVIHTVCSDHAPWSLAAKLDPSHTMTNLRPGVENLQTMLPMLYSEGVGKGRIPLGRLVQVTSSNPARLFGLYPRKGTISVGSDADLVILDPELTLTVEGSMLKSKADHSVYDGWRVTGWPVITMRRGEIVYQDGRITGRQGSGHILRRGPSRPL